jgi:hypothetical protein
VFEDLARHGQVVLYRLLIRCTNNHVGLQ